MLNSGPSLSPDLCLCLSSSRWVNRHSDALCEPGHTPPAPPCLYVSTAIFSLARKDLTLPGPPQHLHHLTSPLDAPCRALSLFQMCSSSSTEPHPHVSGLTPSIRGVMSNDRTVRGLAAPPSTASQSGGGHIRNLFTPEDLEPALRRAELKPHVTPRAARGGVWLGAQLSPHKKHPVWRGAARVGPQPGSPPPSRGRLHPVYIRLLEVEHALLFCLASGWPQHHKAPWKLPKGWINPHGSPVTPATRGLAWAAADPFSSVGTSTLHCSNLIVVT